MQSEVIAGEAAVILRYAKGYDEPVPEIISEIKRNLEIKPISKRRDVKEGDGVIKVSYKAGTAERAFDFLSASYISIKTLLPD